MNKSILANIRFHASIGVFLILAGLMLSSPYYLSKLPQRHVYVPGLSRSNGSAAATTKSTSDTKQVNGISGFPTHLSVPDVGISVNVDPGYYDKNSQTWSLSLTDAEYAVITPQPNNVGGNTFIYGHNRWAVFYKLLNAQPGDEAIITTSNNHTFTYAMVGEQTTSPNDLSLFNYRGAPILTLQTCSGLFYQHRSLFTFKLVKAV